MPADATLPQPVSAQTDQAPLRRRASDSSPAAPGGETPSPTSEDLAIESPDEIHRWTARRRTAVVLSILKGEMTIEGVAGRHGLAASEIEDWKLRLLAAAHNALRSRPRDEDALKDEQIRRLKQKVGELVIEVDSLREALRNARGNSDAEANDD
jgi:transposase-like protein